MHPTQNPVGEVEQTPADHLRHAALYLTRYGWAQGDYYTWVDDNDLLPSACLVGAVNAAVCGKPSRSPDTNAHAREARGALDVIADHLGLTPDDIWDAIAADPADTEDRLTNWNDQHGRTAEQVITELHGAADSYDREAANLASLDAFLGGGR